MKADTKGYAKGLAFIAGTFAVLCIWLLKQYSIQALWKMMRCLVQTIHGSVQLQNCRMEVFW